ncbi:hypothetical protein [Marinoscillum furvescens]|uniref:Uncharacterized protein n=1 Tax=Marinoscillum furvescens DSM 4134 TaxID=1122208 RepID=A0A3D9KYT2_MARFU|nr:hypothetical protein [Marinoscillum furvescens]RED94951.1 hypothetical protein C7460_11963 [Marinoscillum furvescens DSM 4134]
MDRRNLFINGFQLCCFFVFAGRAWQHLFWDAPFRTFFWDESLLSGIVPILTGMSWHEYATSPQVDGMINGIKTFCGAVYTLLAVFSLLAHLPSLKRLRGLLLVGSGMLFLLSLLYFKEKFYQVGQLLEYSIQFGAPLLLYMALKPAVDQRRLILLMKVAIALTFTCHGLYALGYYPQPGHFVSMTLGILSIDETTARLLLKCFGWADVALSILIFVPQASRWALLYAALWGFATAAARIWANIHFDFLLTSLNQWTFETVMRIPHGLVPLLLIYPLSQYFKFGTQKEAHPKLEMSN